MEYIRRKRYANYFDPKCKLYLRHDFNHECAYCKTHENDISDKQVIAERFFEKDHFYPQATKIDDIHDYSNLFYSCEKCNGSKSNECDDLLNPCEQDIFCGEKPYLTGGGIEDDFLYYAKSREAEYYRDVFQLNSRYHIKIRKARYQRILKKMEAKKILENIKISGKLSNEEITILESCMNLDNIAETKEIICGNSEMGHYFCEIAQLLDVAGIKYEIILDEYNQDFKIQIDDQFYNCEVQVDKRKNCVSELHKRLSLNYILNWTDKDINYGMLYYLPNVQQLFFYPINKEKIDFSKSIQNITIVNKII